MTPDEPIGPILGRREALRLLGAAGAAVLASCTRAARLAPATSTPVAHTAQAFPASACVARPATIAGPSFVDTKLDRSDISAGVDGVRLALSFTVGRVSNRACLPLSGATVDVWQCDALGVYSDVALTNQRNTLGRTFLRGYQTTDAAGSCSFSTIYPGWYPTRSPHIHVKIRYGNRDFTTQLFLPDSISDDLFTRAPYDSRGPRDTRNATDPFFKRELLLDVIRDGQGYAATFAVGMKL